MMAVLPGPEFRVAMISRLVISAEQLTAAFAFSLLGLFGLFAGIVGTLGIDEPFDKLIHAGFFFALAANLFFLMGRRALAACLLAFFIGVAGEILQIINPMHTVSVLDVAANAVGIAAFLMATTPSAAARRMWRARRARQILAYLERRRPLG
ncbi:VanZ family protein [Mongoliimonas terrestris]|uniref:VanZ family protein n=1 Tax=Mongoliimonas terrestris TaxID=1709001 RepID=UPI000949A572|nr:VanZ family protein [Mongoliimonas terrestris]